MTNTSITPHSGGPKRSGEERMDDLELIQRLYLQGVSMREIRDAVNRRYDGRLTLTAETIRQDLELLRREWELRSCQDTQLSLAIELAKWDTLESEYWKAYEASRQAKTLDEKQRVTDQIVMAESKIVPVTRTKRRRRTEQRDPLLAALAGVERCIEARCKLLGLYAPTPIDWRVEAVRAGLPEGAAGEMFNVLVGQYVKLMENPGGDTDPDEQN